MTAIKRSSSHWSSSIESPANRYLQLSRRLINARGQEPYYVDLEYQRRGVPGYFPDTAGKVALEYGPIVFCLEGVDHDTSVHTVILNRDVDMESRPDENTGVVTLHTPRQSPTPPSLTIPTAPSRRDSGST